MSIDTTTNYRKAAEPHVNPDTIITKKKYMELEKIVNAHIVFWCNILKAGMNTNNELRIKGSMITHNSWYPSLYFYRKDHKEPVQPVEQAEPIEHPMRPLCDVSDSFSHKFSYLISILLRELTYESDTFCSSSEDLIAEIIEVNNKECSGENSVIGSMDVKSLYPSLDIDMVIDIVAEEFYKSELQICNIDYEEVGLYVAINKGMEYVENHGLSQICPKRRSNRRKPIITGSGALKSKKGRFGPWIKRMKAPDEREERRLMKEAIKIALEIILKNHIYIFDGIIRKQNKGGPIGLDLTEVVAKIFMNWWDKHFLQKLHQLKYEVHMYKRYVDDINICLEAIEEENIEGIIQLDREEQNMEKDEKTFTRLSTLANDITESIKVEMDYPTKNGDNKIPILDLKVWIEKVDDNFKIVYEHYVKPVASKYVINHSSALSLSNKRKILTQQCLKIILNCSKDLQWSTIASHVTEFVKRMQFSGYHQRFRYEIVKSALNAYQKIKTEVNEGIRPMYRKRNWKKEERRKAKVDKRKTWYEKGGYEAVVFVPATPKSKLAKSYKAKIKESGIKIKVVERAGRKIKNILQVNDPLSHKKCNKEDNCLVCNTGKGSCRSSSINYSIRCIDSKCEHIYHGHSSKNGYSRGKEHNEDLKMKREKSVMWKHCKEKHGGKIKRFKMDIKRVNRNDPTKRQITEAIFINKTQPNISMNERTEWNYINLPRLEAK